MIRPIARAVERLAPWWAAPRVRGAEPDAVTGGTLWSSATRSSRALVVYLTAEPASARWLAGSLATRLDALLLVVDRSDQVDDVVAVVARTREATIGDGTLPPTAPVVVVGEGSAAPVALGVAHACASRLALLYPLSVGSESTARVPTTLIQAAGSGPERSRIVEFDRALRRAGVAVRETEYSDVDDGWAKRPRSSKGAARALTDLVGFLDRGIGQASTFDVIPGWDLH